jgi:hypothetical protein
MNWKSIGLHAALVLIAWFVGSGVFGVLPFFMPTPLHADSDLFQRALHVYEASGVWVVYRIGARLFKFPGPTGVMFTLVRLGWCLFAYSIVGGTTEFIIGHPTLAAGVAGIPVAIVVFFLPRPPKRVPQS